MKYFRKKTEKQQSARPIRWQQKWAGWMQLQSERLSRRGKITLWFFCCISFGIYCSLLIIGSLSAPKNTISISQIRLPFYIGKTDKAYKTVITDMEYRKVTSYINYLDSLKNSPEGMAAYDSIRTMRPGLIDSLLIVQQLYLNR